MEYLFCSFDSMLLATLNSFDEYLCQLDHALQQLQQNNFQAHIEENVLASSHFNYLGDYLALIAENF